MCEIVQSASGLYCQSWAPGVSELRWECGSISHLVTHILCCGWDPSNCAKVWARARLRGGNGKGIVDGRQKLPRIDVCSGGERERERKTGLIATARSEGCTAVLFLKCCDDKCDL